MKRLPILEPNDLVHITWLDSAGVMGMWKLKDDIDPIQCIHCESVGFVLDYSQEYIAICQSTSEMLRSPYSHILNLCNIFA